MRPQDGEEGFAVSIFDEQRSQDRLALDALVARVHGLRIEDHLAAQQRLLEPSQDGRRCSGCWVYYPWRNVLVRVLAPDGFARLRARWRLERGAGPGLERLQRARILALGLSSGGDELLSLVTCGVGGRFVLANPDHLCLSREGRIQASTRDLGGSRAVSVARRIRELDPYVRVEVRLEGDAPEDLEALIGRADLVLGTCEDTQIAYLARLAARRARVPVVMRLQGQALIDVDRFDLGDDRSPLGADAVPEGLLSARGRTPLVQRILLGQSCPPGRYRIVQGGERSVCWVGVEP